MAKPRPGQTPPAVVKAIKQDLAAMPKGQRNGLVEIAGKWGVTVSVCEDLGRREKKDIMALREKIAENGFMLAARIDERLVEKLESDVHMAATPLKDLAMAREKVIDSSVTAIDGHQAVVGNINIAFVKEARETLRGYDETLRLKRAKVITVA